MTAPDLPAELRASLDAKLQGLSRRDAAGRAAIISQTYRAGGGSGAIRSETDALAYALARMPATYAAVTASLNALREITPDFAPKACSMSAPGREPRPGRPQRHFRRCEVLACSMPMRLCARWHWISQAAARACAA
jgi:ribosomal protein RSM22 (predicted rRNA methylase)